MISPISRDMRSEALRETTRAGVGLAVGLLRLMATSIRLALLGVLLLLEPIVSTLLVIGALATLVTAILFRFGTHRPDFPFWSMLLGSLACAILRGIYAAAIDALRLRGG